jgi:hypothetical protein
MNYATKVGKPTAHITKKKSRLKVYNGHIVFLNDKDNFEFEIHNPKQHPVLCKIKLNGEYISNSGVVLKPGQRVFLERFFDSNNKFEFSTYEIKDAPQNRSAIDLNGDVLIEFYDEQKKNVYPYNTFTYLGNTGTITTTPYYNNAFTTTSSGTLTNYNATLTSSNTINTSVAGSYTSTIDTGRVERGDKSDQSFTNSYEQFNSFTSNTIRFKILPLSTKNKNVEEIRQYCTECGTKVKKNYKFCPSCGNKI